MLSLGSRSSSTGLNNESTRDKLVGMTTDVTETQTNGSGQKDSSLRIIFIIIDTGR